MKVDEVLKTQFHVWYQFLKKATFASQVIELPKEFIDYLLADNLALHSDQARVKYDKKDSDSDSSSSDEEDNAAWDEAEKQTPSLPVPQFIELDQQIATAIEDFGGKVFIKLNWSSPKDAAWIALNNSLQCIMPSDIHLLLKSSNFILHDLTQPFKDCEDQHNIPETVDYKLVIRKWVEINPGNEFRCFVLNKKLIGISQRDCSHFYPYMLKEKDDIVRDIASFFREQICEKFPLDSYVLDVVRRWKDRVNLIDVNPFGLTTDSILFDWNEPLLTESSERDTPDFRFISEDSGIQSNPLSRYHYPEDVVHLASAVEPLKLIDFLSLQRQRQQADEDSSSSD